MPTYRVDQYELYVSSLSVEADNRAEAIKKVMEGEGKSLDNLTYVQVEADHYQPLDLDDEETKILKKLIVDEDCVPSIRCVELMA